MDKPNRGNTITIKLNDENPKVTDVPKMIEVEPTKQALPKVINVEPEPEPEESEAILETAAAEESVDESFDWIIPESSERDIEEFKIVSSQKIKKIEKKNIKSVIPKLQKNNFKDFRSIIISAVCAIILGTGFGFLMLKLVSTDQNNKPVSEPVIANEQGTTKTNVDTSSAVVKPFTAFVVQGGVFTTKDSAKTTASQLADNGTPSSTVEINGRQYLFIGVSDKIDTAKQLGSYYIGQGMNDVWAHSLQIPEKSVTNITANDKTFLESALTIYQDLSQVTTSAILTTSISDNSNNVISLVAKQINESKQLKNADVKNLQADLANTVGKLQAFQKSKDQKSLADAQQNLLNFLALYYSM